MNELWKAAGAAAWGAVEVSGLQPFIREKEKIEALCPNAKTVLVGAFPYYAGDTPGNLSLYARGEDYHRVLLRRLGGVCIALEKRYPGHIFFPGVDSSPIPEREAARLAGVAGVGRHGLCILFPYGSYIFLGTILTDLALPATGPVAPDPCLPGCQACINACPTKALSSTGCDQTKCLSALSQEKGELPPDALAALEKSPTVWGCDLCQKACPYNKGAALTTLPEFQEDLLPSLTLSDLEGLSNKAFRKKYIDRAFVWRGIAPLLRNLRLKDDV